MAFKPIKPGSRTSKPPRRTVPRARKRPVREEPTQINPGLKRPGPDAKTALITKGRVAPSAFDGAAQQQRMEALSKSRPSNTSPQRNDFVYVEYQGVLRMGQVTQVTDNYFYVEVIGQDLSLRMTALDLAQVQNKYAQTISKALESQPSIDVGKFVLARWGDQWIGAQVLSVDDRFVQLGFKRSDNARDCVGVFPKEVVSLWFQNQSGDMMPPIRGAQLRFYEGQIVKGLEGRDQNTLYQISLINTEKGLVSITPLTSNLLMGLPPRVTLKALKNYQDMGDPIDFAPLVADPMFNLGWSSMPREKPAAKIDDPQHAALHKLPPKKTQPDTRPHSTFVSGQKVIIRDPETGEIKAGNWSVSTNFGNGDIGVRSESGAVMLVNETDLERWQPMQDQAWLNYILEAVKKGSEVFVTAPGKNAERGWNVVKLDSVRGQVLVEKNNYRAWYDFSQLAPADYMDANQTRAFSPNATALGFHARLNPVVRREAKISKKTFDQLCPKFHLDQNNTGNCYWVTAMRNISSNKEFFEALIRTSIRPSSVKGALYEVKVPLGASDKDPNVRWVPVSRSMMGAKFNKNFLKWDRSARFFDLRMLLYPVRGDAVFKILEATYNQLVCEEKGVPYSRNAAEGGFSFKALKKLLGPYVEIHPPIGKFGRNTLAEQWDQGKLDLKGLAEFVLKFSPGRDVVSVNSKIDPNRWFLSSPVYKTAGKTKIFFGHSYSLEEIVLTPGPDDTVLDRVEKVVLINPHNNNKRIELGWGEFIHAFSEIEALRIDFRRAFSREDLQGK